MHRIAAAPALRIAFVAVWATLLAGAWHANLNYAFTPARRAQPPWRWPSESRLGRADQPSLVVFLHAYCPCSRATLRELERLLPRFPAGGKAFCVVSYPHSRDVGGDDLGQAAREIPRLQVVVDGNGNESGLFGVTASGSVLLYDAAGKLRFSGGITAARGHQGANPGSDALLVAFGGAQAATTGTATTGTPATSTPVFGCGLPSRFASSADDQPLDERAK